MTPEFYPQAIIRKLAEAMLPKDPAPFISLRVDDHRWCGYGRLPCSCPVGAWVPEPDVEKACWRVLHILYHLTKAHNISHMDFYGSSHPFVKRGDTDLIVFTQGGYVQGEWDEKDLVKAYGKSFEEAVLRAAEAWLDERTKGEIS